MDNCENIGAGLPIPEFNLNINLFCNVNIAGYNTPRNDADRSKTKPAVAWRRLQIIPDSFALVLSLHREISANDIARWTVLELVTVYQQNRPRAQVCQTSHVVSDEKNSTPLLRHFVHLSQALFLKFHVSHSEDFVNQQNLWL